MISCCRSQGTDPSVLFDTAVPTVILFNCESLLIGVTVTVVLAVPSTIGLELINVDLLPSAPSNSVVSTVADKLVAINLPNK